MSYIIILLTTVPRLSALFVERMKQLLKVGGWAGVILPSSILSNGGIHSKAREIIFKYFKVKAIVELGPSTFMKTNTSTVVLFLERRSDNDFISIEKAINTFCSNLKDVTVLGVENAFSKYVVNAYDDLTFDDYISLISGKESVAMQKHELYSDYKKAFGEDFYAKAIALEKEKLLYFLLTYTQNIVLVKTGKKQEEKAFLGYEFSDRRGHEGIKHLPNGTKLFDEKGDLLNPQKANSYIYNAFLGKTINVDESLANNVSYGRMSGFINYGTNKFDKVVNLNKKFKFETNFPLFPLASIARMIKRGKSASYGNSNIQIIKSGQARGFTEFDFTERYFVSVDFVSDERNLIKGDILINSTGVGTAGRVTLFDLEGNYVVDSHITILRLSSEFALPKYVLFALAHIGFKNIEAMANGQSGQIELALETISDIKIPLPPLDVQQKIVAEIEALETEEEKRNAHIESLRLKRGSYFETQISGSIQQHLGQLAIFNPSKAELSNTSNNTIISFVEMASVSNDGFILSSVERPLSDVRKGSYTYFKENDIIIAKITPCMENGKCALATGLCNGIGMGSSEFHVIRCGSDVLPPFLFGYLNRKVVREEAAKRMTGASGHRRVPISFYEQLEVPLPPLSKQKEIVEEIEKIEAEIKTAQVKLDELKMTKDGVLQRYL